MYRICPSGSSLAALTRSLDIFSMGGNRTSSSFGSMTVGIHLEYAAISSSPAAPNGRLELVSGALQTAALWLCGGYCSVLVALFRFRSFNEQPRNRTRPG